MKKIFIFMLLIGVSLLSGCTEAPENISSNTKSPTENSVSDSPKEIAEAWVKSIICGRGSEKVFNYLHPDVKLRYTSYDEWNDEVYNINYAWKSQGIYFQLINIQNEMINGSNASVDVKYEAKILGYGKQTITQKYEFIKLNGEWKLNEYYELDT